MVQRESAAVTPADPTAAFSGLHHRHAARLLADVAAAPPPDRALAYLFHGQGEKSATIAAMAAATGREIILMHEGGIPLGDLAKMMVVYEGENYFHRHLQSRYNVNRLNYLMGVSGVMVVVTTSRNEIPQEVHLLNRTFEVLEFGANDDGAE